MGLPIRRLIVATNANDILDKFFSKGEYHKADEVVPTCTPSMGIEFTFDAILVSIVFISLILEIFK